MSELTGQVGELRMTLKITRKETGNTDTVEIVGYVDESKLKDIQNGSNTQHSGTQRGD